MYDLSEIEVAMKKILILLFNLIIIFAFCGLSVFADDAEQIIYNAPDEIKGVIITPGDEFASETDQDEETVKKKPVVPRLRLTS